jgi:hypothetical protein
VDRSQAKTRRRMMIPMPATDQDEPVLLDRIGVAKLLYVKPRSIKEYIKRGVLQPLRVPGGRKW